MHASIYIESFLSTWIKSKKLWKPREKGGQIGRLVYAYPAKGERYYLRVLLNHVRGATSFEHLRSRHGTTYVTFRDTCEFLGYVDTDKNLDDCLTESAQLKMPCALRRLFATIWFSTSVIMSAHYGTNI